MKVVSLDYPLSKIVEDLRKEDLLVSKDEDGTVLGVNEVVLLRKNAWKLSPETKFKDVAVPIPTIKEDYPLEKIAELMVGSSFYELPYEDLTKSIHAFEVLEKGRKKLKQEVETYFGDYIDVDASEPILTVLYEMKRKKVHYATVLEERVPIGIISLKEIFSKIIFPKRKPRQGEFVDEYESVYRLPAKDFVEEIVIDTDDIQKVVDLLLEKRLRAAPVLYRGHYVGTVTIDELLKAIAVRFEEGNYFLQLTSNVELMDADKEQIRKEFEKKIWKRFGEFLKTATVYIDIRREKGVDPDNLEYFWHVRIRLWSPRGKFVIDTKGYSLYHTLKLALKELAEEIRKKKQEIEWKELMEEYFKEVLSQH